jgi:hypothetical protein
VPSWISLSFEPLQESSSRAGRIRVMQWVMGNMT